MGEFYKMDYDAWDEGTIELSLEEEAAYLRLCHQIYRRKGAVPNSMKLLCSIWRCHSNRATRILMRLVDAGKITLNDDDQLVNERALAELQNRAAKTRNTPHQIQPTPTQIPKRSKDLSVCSSQPLEKPQPKNTEERRLEERRGEAANAAKPAPRFQKPKLIPIPIDYAPTPATIKWCMAQGAGREFIDSQAMEFKVFWIGDGRLKADWDSIFQARILQQLKFQRPGANRPAHADPYGD